MAKATTTNHHSATQQQRAVYLACHGMDGTLLTRPPGFGPNFASHAQSELQALLVPGVIGASLDNDPCLLPHPHHVTATATTTASTTDNQNDNDNNNKEWNGSPIQISCESYTMALNVAKRLVTSELWQVIVSSTVGLEDFIHQVLLLLDEQPSSSSPSPSPSPNEGNSSSTIEEMIRTSIMSLRNTVDDNDDETTTKRNNYNNNETNKEYDIGETSWERNMTATEGTTVTTTWHLGFHSWLPSSQSPRDLKASMARIRTALTNKLHQVCSSLSSSSSPSSSVTITHVPTAVKAMVRFAVLLYYDVGENYNSQDDSILSSPSSLSSSSLRMATYPTTYTLAIQVGGGSIVETCHRHSQLMNSLLVSSSSKLFLTPIRPPLAILMANLACISKGSIVLDPFSGSGSLLWGAAQVGATLCLGSELNYTQEAANIVASSTDLVTELKFVQQRIADNNYNKNNKAAADLMACNAFTLPNMLRQGPWLDAIITDPPYGLREGQGTVNRNYGSTTSSGGGGTGDAILKRPDGDMASHIDMVATVGGSKKDVGDGVRSSETNKTKQSQCYIQDHSGQELLDSVSYMMKPIFKIAAQSLKPGGRLVYLLPIFPSQSDLVVGGDGTGTGLWGLTGALDNETRQHIFAPILQQHPELEWVSAERHRCKKRGMARVIVVFEKKEKQLK